MAYTKEEKKLIKDLKKAEVELTGEETSEQLVALAEEHGIKDEQSTDVLENASEKVGVRYINPNTGDTVREFSLEVHGEDFKDIAKGFCDKFAGEIVTIE